MEELDTAIVAMSEIKVYGRLPSSEILWMDEAFPVEIEKILQEVNYDNEDYAIGSDFDSDHQENVSDTIC